MQILTHLPENWQTLDNVLLVHFVRQWSGSALFTRTHVAAANKRFAERVVACEIDAELNPELLETFRISEIPTLLVIHKGHIEASIKGLFTQKKLDDTIGKVLKSTPNAPNRIL